MPGTAVRRISAAGHDNRGDADSSSRDRVVLDASTSWSRGSGAGPSRTCWSSWWSTVPTVCRIRRRASGEGGVLGARGSAQKCPIGPADGGCLWRIRTEVVVGEAFWLLRGVQPWDCKSIAKASKVRILHLPPRAQRALDQWKRRSGALSCGPAVSGSNRLIPRTRSATGWTGYRVVKACRPIQSSRGGGALGSRVVESAQEPSTAKGLAAVMSPTLTFGPWYTVGCLLGQTFSPFPGYQVSGTR